MNDIVTINDANGMILMYKIINPMAVTDADNISFMARDIMGLNICTKIVEILYFTSVLKDKGLKVLNELCSEFKDSIIIIKSEPTYDSFEQYKAACASGAFDIESNRLCKYYTSCGFIDINSYINYENGKAFIYNNESGKKVLNAIKNIGKEGTNMDFSIKKTASDICDNCGQVSDSAITAISTKNGNTIMVCNNCKTELHNQLFEQLVSPSK